MNLSYPKLLLRGVPQFFVSTYLDVNPVSGQRKVRTLYKPNRPMRILHRRLVRELRQLGISLPYATGALPGSSPRRNVERHKSAKYIYLLDIQDAFPSVDGRALALVLCSIDSELAGQREEDVFRFLRAYCLTGEVGLPIGAPASSDLYNLYAGILLDEPLGELCVGYGITYTRYLDDLTLSSLEPIGERKRKAIRRTIVEAGFRISPHKAHYYNLSKGPAVINGIGLELGGRTFLPRGYSRTLLGMIHQAARGEIDLCKIHGAMGVFWSSKTTGRGKAAMEGVKLNRTEQRVVAAYQKLKQMFGEVRSSQPRR